MPASQGGQVRQNWDRRSLLQGYSTDTVCLNVDYQKVILQTPR